MSDPFVSDDVLEAVLRSRAGDGVPSDLHARSWPRWRPTVHGSSPADGR